MNLCDIDDSEDDFLSSDSLEFQYFAALRYEKINYYEYKYKSIYIFYFYLGEIFMKHVSYIN